MIRITRKGARALGFAAAVFWMLGGLLGIVRWIAGDAGLLSGEMLRYAPPQYSGLPAEAYPDTGRMVADYFHLIQSRGHLVSIPCLFISVSVLCITMITHGLRDALDPKEYQHE